jgi:hypothetical protein
VKELLNYLKHSNQTHLSLHSISAVSELLLHFTLTHCTANSIGPEAAFKLSEVLLSNTALTALDLNCNTFVVSFHFHSIQVIKLSEAIKSNSSLTSIDLSCRGLVVLISFSLDTANALGNEGAAKLAEALKSNSPLVLLNLGSNTCCFHVILT